MQYLLTEDEYKRISRTTPSISESVEGEILKFFDKLHIQPRVISSSDPFGEMVHMRINKADIPKSIMSSIERRIR